LLRVLSASHPVFIHHFHLLPHSFTPFGHFAQKIEDPKTYQFRAKQIYDKYFADASPFQINVSSNILGQIKKRIETSNIDSSLYQPAQSAVFSLLEMDSFPRFLQSEKYQTYKGMNCEKRERKKERKKEKDRERKKERV
jgi:hypothetical protein